VREAGSDPLERVRLTRALWLWQRRGGHRSATDDVLCAWGGVEAAPDARWAVDLGTGQGSVVLMLAGALPAARFLAIEVQPRSVELCRRNVAENELNDRIEVCEGDFREAALVAQADLVTGSPPFVPLGSGTLPRDPQRAAGRFELRGGVEDYARSAARAMAPQGVLVLLMDGASEIRTRGAIRAAGLHVRRVTRVLPREGAAPRFLLWEAARAEAELQERELAVRDARGAWTIDFLAIRRRLDLPGAA
jgi:tRNA1(Val) A37 N6-methylase TrmN6